MGGGIGRRGRLKIFCPIGRAGSSPASSTEFSVKLFILLGIMLFNGAVMVSTGRNKDITACTGWSAGQFKSRLVTTANDNGVAEELPQAA